MARSRTKRPNTASGRAARGMAAASRAAGRRPRRQQAEAWTSDILCGRRVGQAGGSTLGSGPCATQAGQFASMLDEAADLAAGPHKGERVLSVRARALAQQCAEGN